jgi:serine/threonine protein kinase/Tol biopolymer transport system component
MIDPERWQQIDALLLEALEREPPERVAFLKEATAGDETLRLEVESLLASSEHPLSLIETPAFEAAAGLLSTHIPELSQGELLGNYRILSFIGAGGMGEVYLAEDRKLDRRVAIKLLPAGSNLDQKQLQRFQQEARAASALNHPNILTIHELGEVDGRQFIATEFVEGETLRQQMKRGRLDMRDALDIAMQTASALAAAHHAGIVHRDVKPENIMLRPDGYVKVLDFGLAKLTRQYERTPEARTAAHVDTSSGLVMGTVKYMSPEQARGLPVDPRSDIFSFGIVLYEMLAGHTPFKANKTTDLIKAILNAEPTPISQLVPELPIELEQMVCRALARNRADRYQTMTDVLAGLGQLKRRLDAEQTLSGGQDIASTIGVAKTSPGSEFPSANATQSITRQVVSMISQHKLQAGVMFLGVLVAVGGIFYSSARRWRKPHAFQEVQMTPLVETDRSRMSAISPDGKYVAHTVVDRTGESLLLRTVATNNNTVLVPPSGAGFFGITFSRDENYVYYVLQATDDAPALYRVPLTGGDSEKILPNVASPITFSPDGKRFAFVRETSRVESGLFVTNTDGTQERMLGQRKSPNFFSPAGPSWSADGRLIACAVYDEQPDKQPSFMNVAGINVDDGTEKLLTNGKWAKVLQIAWLTDNSGFIMAATQKGQGALLWYVSYPEGNLRRITNDPSNYPSDYNSVSLTADSGTLVASRFEQRTNLWSAPPGDPDQIKQITFGGNHRFQRLAWTTDGKIVFPSDATGDRELWMMEGNGGSLKQLTADGRSNQFPSVSPDGRYIVYVSAGESRQIWRMNVDGSGAVQLTHGGDQFGPQVSSDGRWVFYMSVTAGKVTIWKVPIDGGEPQPFTKEVSTWPAVSPDGMKVACWFWSAPNSPPKIAVIPFAGGTPVKILEPLPGVAKDLPLRWTSSGEDLIYCVTRNETSNVWSQPLDGSPPKELTDFKSETIQGFDWSRDDRLLLSRGFTAREIVLIRSVNP